MITGSIVAMVTPMREDGSVDDKALYRLIDFHIDQGTDAIVAVGTTGESATLTMEENAEVIAKTVKHVAGRIPVIGGTGANSTAEAIELSRNAQESGVDACLTVAPYYNKPNQEGIYQHFKAIAEAAPIPHILYNVPARTVADIHNETVLRLAQISNIVGLKDATGDVGRGCDLLRALADDFAVYSGEDPSSMALMLAGAHGSISVTANVAPKLMHEMCAAAIADEATEARRTNNLLIPLHRALFVEPSPMASKWALQQLGLIEGGIRLPLVSLPEHHYPVVTEAMKVAGVI